MSRGTNSPANAKDGVGPLYLQLAETLIASIETGKYRVGDQFPPEETIASTYGVSRHTARAALKHLVDEGLIERQRGRGTQVRAGQRQRRYVASMNSVAELVQHVRGARLKILSETWARLDRPLSRLLRAQPGSRWLIVDACRYPLDSADPLSHTIMYLRGDYADRVRVNLHRGSPSVFELIERHYGKRVVEVLQSIEAIAMPEASAALLDAEPGSPALHVLRSFVGQDDRVIAAAVNIYPKDRFKMTTRWRLEREPTTE